MGLTSLSYFLSIHFPCSTFSGRLQVGCRSMYKSAIIPALTCDYSQVSELVPALRLSDKANYYITANAFSGVSRLSADLFSFHNLVLDVDCHEEVSSLYLEDSIDSLLWRLDHSLWDNGVPYPTSIVRTGRGLQFWWSITGISVKFKSFYEELLSFYITEVENFLTAGPLEDLSMFAVDSGASRNCVGYFRLPETVNTKAGCLVTFSTTEKHYELMDLFADYKRHCEPPKPKVEVRPVGDTFEFISQQRVEALYLLRDLRGAGIGAEERNNFCFMAYNATVPLCGHEMAYAKMMSFNTGFKSPMTERELADVIASAKKKGGYQYKQRTWLEFLNVSPEEARLIGFPSEDVPYLNKKQQASLQSASRKKERDAQVVALYSQGKTMCEIRTECKVSLPTISKIINASAKPKKTDKAMISKYLHEGKSLTQVASLCNCSKRTVQRHSNALRENSEPLL